MKHCQLKHAKRVIIRAMSAEQHKIIMGLLAYTAIIETAHVIICTQRALSSNGGQAEVKKSAVDEPMLNPQQKIRRSVYLNYGV